MRLFKEYRKKYNNPNVTIGFEVKIRKDSDKKGRSDVLICSKDLKERYILIEHENSPSRTLLKDVQKLSHSKSDYKLLITYYDESYNHYYGEDYPKSRMIEELQRHIDKYFGNGQTLYLLIAPYSNDNSVKYEIQILTSKNENPPYTPPPKLVDFF